ncbi:MAG: gamma-glutamyltransferase [Verrucomicrobiaceae bacterium]|nr:gamma-glutamyltransferase [Verrucomicrobiaceae bacterium]
MKSIQRLVVLALLSGNVALAADNSNIPEAASALNLTQSASATHYMAVTANPHATAAAAAMLKRGGSAVDAAIAAQLVLGLTEPQSSGIGGGAFALYWESGKQKLHYFDGRETAPAAVDENYFMQDDGKPMPFADAVIGGHSVGVPGVVRLLALTHKRYGKLPWATLFEPAIALAQNGFAISPRLYTVLKETPRLLESSALREHFFLPDGNPKPIGSLLKNPAYAKTLQQVARGGEAAFYGGPIAGDMVAAVNFNANRTGKLALKDLADYRAVERDPICAAYLSYTVCGAAPPSSGGTTVLAILGMLQQFSPEQRAPSSAGFYHVFAEASALAFADRDTYVADPDFTSVPTAGLVAPDYLAARAALIDPAKTMPMATAGEVQWPKAAQRVNYLASASPELLSTSHLSIVDNFGNAFTMTTSVESAFGSRIFVDGFILNNQLTDFSFTPRDADGKRVANRIEPGKRPRSAMAPTMVFKDNKPMLLIGSPGSARIIDYVAKTLVYVLDGTLPLSDAIASPHIISLNRGIELEPGRSDAEKSALMALGHSVKEVPQSSGLNGIFIDRKILTGVADPRREGTAAGN